MSSSVKIKLPQPDDLDAVFYETVAKTGKLCIQHCGDCGTWTHPARYYCPECASENLAFEAVSGEATAHSFTVSHFTVEPAWKDLVPYVTIVAELKEGPRVIARTKMGADDISIDMPIKLDVEVLAPEFSYVWASKAEG
ncbi:MAG: Zn-ribbon domain-containing OB-fold protein [Flavobacteriaceae bacterium]